MNRYNSYELFMIDVVNKANSISNLNDLFDVKYEELIDILIKIIKVGWWAFVALCVLLAMGPIAFAFSMGSFLLTPPGFIIGGVLGIAAATIFRQIYRNKELPLAIKRVGAKYESRWKSANEHQQLVDAILKDAVSDLLHSGKNALSYRSLDLLNKYFN